MAFDFPFVKEALTQLFQKSSCEEYPFKPKEAFPRFRGRIVFHPEKCIKCGMCERVCAGGSISNALVGTTEETELYERTFDLTSCTFCSYCADFCSTDAIELTPDFEHLMGTKHEELLVKGVYERKKRKPAAPKAAKPAAPKAEEKPAEAKEEEAEACAND